MCLFFARREIWRFCDCRFLIDGEPNIGTKAVDEVVMASDGFPDLRPTLHQSESRLQELLEIDPAAVAEL